MCGLIIANYNHCLSGVNKQLCSPSDADVRKISKSGFLNLTNLAFSVGQLLMLLE